MALITQAQYLDSMKKLKPKVYIGGKWVKNLLDNPVTKSMVMANAAMYWLAEQPEHKEVMVAKSHLTGEPINRNLNVARNIHDLDMRQEMALLTSQTVGTCNYRCVGCDALNSVAATTWEMDRDLGTKYNERFNKWLAYAQKNDLAVSGAITDAKGDRKKRPSQQDDLDVYLHLVEKRDDGIVVRGYKVSQSGAIGSHETLVLPGGALREGEEKFALAFAVQNSVPGLSYICQYNAYSAEREMFVDDPDELGNPIYGQRETSTMIFDNVFIPWERVFLFGETKYAGRMVTRFAKAHRMNCGGACKVGFADVIIGGTLMAAEAIGVEKVPHIQEKIVDMVRYSETSHACAIAAAMRGREEPKGSGVYLPDDLFGNAAKLNIAHGFWEILKNAGDIGGGLVVTMPRLKDLKDPEVGPVLKKVFGAAAPAETRLKIAKFLQHWTSGLHGAGTWHGAGAPQTQRFMFTVLTDFEKKKKLARKLMGMKEEDAPVKAEPKKAAK
ncbi:MAG TPA: 4-hydroxyphenylacetate 3-hydroxylase N-terminal domain-containing protein [Syntrophales bacterium]|nr:4-hydroxyphenylacetate 3-hydroxylase N-terminal domain-containing protein [Syntrophales bacterium]HOX93950.1 4-hydroxyphenylacetate 3-hydroxylase N-terminal domain-containing protein [Syntrophales bacterium]HPI56121.1 4-hydroxyphenylacetate 3-hydroxylase N-terminal domain-containing protein [Syntrophales bacterium]HPN23989.1 4-hydroxyphenylacetate 3-hydroxylase N-terminal domain-containing protein [Syntrophales bacterium]HQM28268.1 4-hydroxyphenylacetate 3-hydroxylase N-terminal domain-conta